MEQRTDIRKILDNLDPGELDYQEWVNVGMALKHEGYSASDWDEWSRRDFARYHEGECFKKWNSFHGSSDPVTGGTVVQMAMEHGWTPDNYDGIGCALEWDAEISTKGIVVDSGWVEEKETHEPKDWNPAKQVIRYLETLFEAGENVGYVTGSWEKKDDKGTRWLPQKGSWDRTAGRLIEEINKCHGDIGAVLGDYNPKAGAWIRFNPLDGRGCKNENVTDFRYALVESDNMEIERQNALIRELELPVACLVHSGKKSLHAIVRVEAADYKEYRKRVDYLYDICKKNGLKVDTQNKNPSRLSRLPGVERDGKKQYIVDTNIGKESWDEWYKWIESINDNLPEPESLENVWGDLPELSPCLIENVLRKGHKMLISGPSKAGKSFLQIELCIAIAEGTRWLGWQCTKGRVLYVNLELDRASCLHRFKDVYEALGIPTKNLANIDIWNLRGKAVPMDKLAPKLIRRATKKNYEAVIIDPIYKVITGDENSADQMSNFCNQFDKVCTELGCAVIYCHHHSKGAQGAKRAMDRASGSGVFSRDPDALLDLIGLELTEDLLKQEENKASCVVCERMLKKYGYGEKADEELGQDDYLSDTKMLQCCGKMMKKSEFNELTNEIDKACKAVRQRTAWRVDGTLREFPKFEPINTWFDYPIHRKDESGVLKDIQTDGEVPPWQKKAKKKSPEEKKKENMEKLKDAFEQNDLDGTGKVKMSDIEEYMGITTNTVKKYVDWSKEFERNNGMVSRCQKH